MRGFQSLRSRLVVWFLLAIVPLAGFGVFSHFRIVLRVRPVRRSISDSDKPSR